MAGFEAPNDKGSEAAEALKVLTWGGVKHRYSRKTAAV